MATSPTPYVLAKMKLWTRGRYLFTRTISSTVVGRGSTVWCFYPLAFLGVWEPGEMMKIVVFNWVFKVTVETVPTPGHLSCGGIPKRAEGEDYFDDKTNFTPFSISD